jgi:hypothetical protein
VKILFALNQDKSRNTEEAIISVYSESNGVDVQYKKEYDLDGVKNALLTEHFDMILMNEELERDNTVATTYIDEITDKYPDIRIILLVASYHEKDAYVRKLFNIGVYDIIYAHDINIDRIIELMKEPRTKMQAKEYLGLSDVEDAVVESELRTIPEDQLDSIVSYFMNSDGENYSGIFEHINRQYNEYQMVHLVRNLPLEVKTRLANDKHELYLKYADRVDDYEDDTTQVNVTAAHNKPKSDLFKIPQFNKRDKDDVRTVEKTVEKIIEKEVIKVQKETEYISIVPEDYKKVAAFTGSHSSGVTTMVDMVATELSQRGKKVAVLDFTLNKSLFYMKCWGKEDLTYGMKNSLVSLNDGKIEPVVIGEGYHLFTVGSLGETSFDEDSFNFYKALELIRYNYDIILLEFDMESRYKWLSFGVSSIYLVNDLNVVNMIPIKRNVKELVKMGVNQKKFHLIVNKYIKSKTKAEDMLACITSPLPHLEYNEKSSSVEINQKVFKVRYSDEFYLNHIESLLYVGDKVDVPKEMREEILEICQEIYPLDLGKSKSKGILGKLFS